MRLTGEPTDNGTYETVLATVVWFDAFNNRDQATLEKAIQDFKVGLPIITTGILVDDEDESVLIAQDWLAPIGQVRNFQRVRKCCIDVILAVTLEWNKDDDGNPEWHTMGIPFVYTGWRDGSEVCAEDSECGHELPVPTVGA